MKKKVISSECIEHTGYVLPGGYGTVGTHKYGTRYAHRVAWIKVHGPIAEGLEIDHLCNNRICINIDHLEAVTPAENVRRRSSTKLTEEDVIEIRKLVDVDGLLHREVAEKYGVHEVHIGKILARKRWANV